LIGALATVVFQLSDLTGTGIADQECMSVLKNVMGDVLDIRLDVMNT